MASVYIPVQSLPPFLRDQLSGFGYHRPDIAVEARERFTFEGAYGDGYRAFASLVNLETAETRTLQGSWGGGNIFTKNPVDDDRNEHPIPVNGAVIAGQEGGGKPVSARLILHPANVTKYLPAKADISDAEKRVLVMFRSYTSAYRRANLRPSDDATIDGLVSRGFLKRNKAGACAITTEGKNAVAAERGY